MRKLKFSEEELKWIENVRKRMGKENGQVYIQFSEIFRIVMEGPIKSDFPIKYSTNFKVISGQE